MATQGAAAQQAPRTRDWFCIFGIIVAGFFLIVLGCLAIRANGHMGNVQLVWDVSWLAATVVIVLAVLWCLRMTPPEREVTDDILRQILDEVRKCTGSNVKAPTSGGQAPDPEKAAAAQVLATLISSQDHTTWLAFTLGMTSEVVLITGFIQAASSQFNWVLALGGVLLAGVFWNMVLRSNADMSALYKKADLLWKQIFHVPRTRRSGISARLVMNVTFGGWIIAWLAAMAFVLNPLV